MIIDKTLQTDDGKAVTTATTTVSTDEIDLGAGYASNVGKGEPLFYVVTLAGIPDAGNSDETYVFSILSGAASAPTTVVATITVPRGTEDAVFYALLPSTTGRFIRHSLVTGGTSPSITFDSFVTSQEPQSWSSTADAI